MRIIERLKSEFIEVHSFLNKKTILAKNTVKGDLWYEKNFYIIFNNFGFRNYCS